MSLETTITTIYRCDLCKSVLDAGQLVAQLYARREVTFSSGHPESYGVVQICGECENRPIKELLFFFSKLFEGRLEFLHIRD